MTCLLFGDMSYIHGGISSTRDEHAINYHQDNDTGPRKGHDGAFRGIKKCLPWQFFFATLIFFSQEKKMAKYSRNPASDLIQNIVPSTCTRN